MISVEYVPLLNWDVPGGERRITKILDVNDDDEFEIKLSQIPDHPISHEETSFLVPFKILRRKDRGPHQFVAFCCATPQGTRNELAKFTKEMSDSQTAVTLTQCFDISAGDDSPDDDSRHFMIDDLITELLSNKIKATVTRDTKGYKLTVSGNPLSACDDLWTARWFLSEIVRNRGRGQYLTTFEGTDDFLSVEFSTFFTRDIGGIGMLDLFKSKLLNNSGDLLHPYRRMWKGDVFVSSVTEKHGFGSLIDTRPSFMSDPYEAVGFIMERTIVPLACLE